MFEYINPDRDELFDDGGGSGGNDWWVGTMAATVTATKAMVMSVVVTTKVIWGYNGVNDGGDGGTESMAMVLVVVVVVVTGGRYSWLRNGRDWKAYVCKYFCQARDFEYYVFRPIRSLRRFWNVRHVNVFINEYLRVSKCVCVCERECMCVCVGACMYASLWICVYLFVAYIKFTVHCMVDFI